MASDHQPANILLGTHTIGDATVLPGIIHFDDAKDVKALLDRFYERGYRGLDTGGNYPASEARLGSTGSASRFTIHTKVADGPPGSHKAANIESRIEQSLADLQTSSVETMMLHVPDRETPFEEAIAAMDKGFKQGKFKKIGLSNYRPDEVEKILTICEEKGYKKPEIYEGHYNAIVRGAEKDLFPILRKNGMSFFGYSPAAGGLFTGNAGKSDSSKRWSLDNPVGQNYNRSYGSPAVEEAAMVVREAAQKHGISGHSATLRWAVHHSKLDGKYGDSIVFGVRTIEQLDQTLDGIESGPLPKDLADAISAVYGAFKEDEQPSFHL